MPESVWRLVFQSSLAANALSCSELLHCTYVCVCTCGWTEAVDIKEMLSGFHVSSIRSYLLFCSKEEPQDICCSCVFAALFVSPERGGKCKGRSVCRKTTPLK